MRVASLALSLAALSLPPCASETPQEHPSTAKTDVRCPQGTVDLAALVGLDEEAGTARAARSGCRLRVVERDNMALIKTDDLRRERINVATDDGRIVRVVFIG